MLWSPNLLVEERRGSFCPTHAFDTKTKPIVQSLT